MANNRGTAKPSPATFFDCIHGYQRTAALKAAIDLDVFTRIGEGAETIPDLARQCQCSGRGMRILCDALTIYGLLEKTGEAYHLTWDTAVYLDRNSPAYIGRAAYFITSSLVMDGYQRLTEAVRQGGSALGAESAIAPDHPVWVEFARSMAPLMKPAAASLAKLLEAERLGAIRVLDVAAGHGLFGITLAEVNVGAEVFALDWAGVLALAMENAAVAGVAGRYHPITGSVFEQELGRDYDLVLLTNFLHHFPPVEIEALLRRVHAALKPGGRAVTLEFVPNEDRVSPAQAAAFSLTMLAMTPGGDAYPWSELDRMFQKAGFAPTTLHPLPPTFERVVIAERAAV